MAPNSKKEPNWLEERILKQPVRTTLMAGVICWAAVAVVHGVLYWRDGHSFSEAFRYFFSIEIFGSHVHIAGFFVGILGALIAAWAERSAVAARDRAEEARQTAYDTLIQLRDYNLLFSETKSDFLAIFKVHLVEQLEKYRNTPVICRLLLSTPAYGFPVLGDAEYVRFSEAFASLETGSDVELIFFCPDVHVQHWVNTLLWSPLRNTSAPAKFAIEFASHVRQMLTTLNGSRFNWRLWLTDEVSLRMFAFEATLPDRKVHDVYVVFSDRVRIANDQSTDGGKGFRARGFPIHRQVVDHIVGPNSYFDQLKRCPYMQLTGNDVAIRCPQRLTGSERSQAQKMLKLIEADYLLGRTEQQVFDFSCFDIEMGRFINAFSELSRVPMTSDEILAKSLKAVSDYFVENLPKASAAVPSGITPLFGQMLVLAAISHHDEFTPLNPQLAECFADTEFANVSLADLLIPKFPFDTWQTTISWKRMVQLLGREDPQQARDRVANKLQDLKGAHDLSRGRWPLFFVYALVSSGFLESAYAAAAREKRRQMDAARAVTAN